eukprot:NODE_4939_length_1092_cov_38.292054_g4387_i0.p1 GENE.NODE_4939_length_1092_cov_38.292054_g4387_i0~~NODE_4939_length_1092_cov_38.292054_g4387_i0.p1  ORF type:complete len:280 (-),score=39.93 NODE_4939_length_1092_cov_38.292054_g4387_i0:167-1006(-)
MHRNLGSFRMKPASPRLDLAASWGTDACSTLECSGWYSDLGNSVRKGSVYTDGNNRMMTPNLDNNGTFVLGMQSKGQSLPSAASKPVKTPASITPLAGVLRISMQTSLSESIRFALSGIGNGEAYRESNGCFYLFVNDLARQTLSIRRTGGQETISLVGLEKVPKIEMEVGGAKIQLSFVECRLPTQKTLRYLYPSLSDSDEEDDPSTELDNLIKDEDFCLLCHLKQRDVILPCSHVVMCQSCADHVLERFGRCPLCDEPFIFFNLVTKKSNQVVRMKR